MRRTSSTLTPDTTPAIPRWQDDPTVADLRRRRAEALSELDAIRARIRSAGTRLRAIVLELPALEASAAVDGFVSPRLAALRAERDGLVALMPASGDCSSERQQELLIEAFDARISQAEDRAAARCKPAVQAACVPAVEQAIALIGQLVSLSQRHNRDVVFPLAPALLPGIAGGSRVDCGAIALPESQLGALERWSEFAAAWLKQSEVR